MRGQAIQILLIEDHPGDARLLQELLLDAQSMPFQLEQVDHLSQGLQRLQAGHFDVILLDLSLPDSNGFDTFLRLHHCVGHVPILVITGLNDETLAVRAVQEGAQDYLVKGQVTSDLLMRSIRYAIERKRAEHKICEQAALLNITSDAILVCDLDHRILFWNKGAEHLYGWTAEDVLSHSISNILQQSSLSELQEAKAILLQQGEWSGELHQTTRNGKAIVIASRWTLMRNDDYNPKSILIVSTDITEKKTLETQSLRAQRMESLGTLASGLAHDLNNILTPILSTAQLLQIKFPHADQRSQQLLKMLELNTKRGAALVQQVLSFARGIEGERRSLHLPDLIFEVFQIIEETFPQSITTHIELSPDLWTITGNATQLHQVLMNLCVNARDAMPTGGRLTITAQNLCIDEHYIRTNLDARIGPFVQITVTDTGVGITPEILDRIFEPFFTTKEFGKGTGLGLSTALGIIKGHRGFLNVSSQLDKGTQFTLYFPAVIASETWELHDPNILAGNNELVLVVDDETAICDSNKALLEAYNYQVLTASSGIDAIALYAQHQDNISLVLVDMMMPSMDGAMTIRTLQKINPHVKIIAVSGLISSAQMATTASPGIQSFLPKPYTAKELVTTVNQVCSARLIE
jgi:PAS domain S-box-containing protein